MAAVVVVVAVIPVMVLVIAGIRSSRRSSQAGQVCFCARIIVPMSESRDRVCPYYWGEWRDEPCESLLCEHAVHSFCLNEALGAKGVDDVLDLKCPVCRQDGRSMEALGASTDSASAGR